MWNFLKTAALLFVAGLALIANWACLVQFPSDKANKKQDSSSSSINSASQIIDCNNNRDYDHDGIPNRIDPDCPTNQSKVLATDQAPHPGVAGVTPPNPVLPFPPVIPGPPGPPGPPGFPGEEGLSGQDGADGRNGRNGQTGQPGTPGENGSDGTDGNDGEDGDNGIRCWDLNSNGVCDLLTEDVDLDQQCTALDCRGVDGDDGQAGNDGTNCWDLNENDSCDLLTEDLNNDQQCTALDCQCDCPDDPVEPFGVCGNGIQEVSPQSEAPCPHLLYGATTSGPLAPSQLFFLDETLGTGTLIGTITSVGNIRRVNALDFSPEGVLYGAGTVGNAWVLATIDCQTATASIVGLMGLGAGQGRAVTDINFDSQGRLFAYYNTPDNMDVLGIVNRNSGQFTTIGLTGLNDIGNGIAFAPFLTDTLYHAGFLDLSTLSVMTGAATTVASPLVFLFDMLNRPRINGIDTDFFLNYTYASFNNRGFGNGAPAENYLSIVNRNTGEVHLLTDPPNLAPPFLDGVAVNRVYETCDQGGFNPNNQPPIPIGAACNDGCGLMETDCTDNVDNDFDGFIDCEDPDCDAQECDDGNQCTGDGQCINGACLFAVVVPNETPCDDGINCTENDECTQGICAGTPLDCTSAQICLIGACVEALGTCVFSPNTGADCDIDLNPCLDHICSAQGECVGVDDDMAACTDGNSCTADMCQDGMCVGTPPSPVEICDNLSDDNCDGNIDEDCDVEICDDGQDNDSDGDTDCADSDCDMQPCDDGNLCTSPDTCSGGSCVGVPNMNACDDGNPCTDDQCSGGVCVGTNDNSNVCSDSNGCTNFDQCVSGVCMGTPVVCPSDTNVCTDDVCVAGMCVNLANMASCMDGNVCTDDQCSGGLCVGTPDNTNVCTDNDTCTLTDVCLNGQCIGSGVPPGLMENCNNGIDDDCDDLADDNDPDCQFLVFVTSTTTDGDFGGLVSADNECNNLAATASPSPLPGTYVAFLSASGVGNSAAERITNDGPWYLVTGGPLAKVADNKVDLLNSDIDTAINVDEDGNDVMGSNNEVWTGSSFSGAYLPPDCNGWSSNDGNVKGIRGSINQTDDKWSTLPGNGNCNSALRFYCFQIGP